MKKTLKPLLAVLAGAVLAIGSAGCSGSADSGEGNETGPITNPALPPEIAETTQLQDETFLLVGDQELVINVDDPASWTGETSDPSVAEFEPGSDDGSVSYNPGFTPKSPGTTAASLTSPGGDVYEFTIVVEESAE